MMSNIEACLKCKRLDAFLDILPNLEVIWSNMAGRLAGDKIEVYLQMSSTPKFSERVSSK